MRVPIADGLGTHFTFPVSTDCMATGEGKWKAEQLTAMHVNEKLGTVYCGRKSMLIIIANLIAMPTETTD